LGLLGKAQNIQDTDLLSKEKEPLSDNSLIIQQNNNTNPDAII
jgi:hypothetical protein